MPPRNLSSAIWSALSTSLPSEPMIGPFQMAKEPSFRPALTVSTLALTSAGTLSEMETMSIAPSFTPHHALPVCQVPSRTSPVALM